MTSRRVMLRAVLGLVLSLSWLLTAVGPTDAADSAQSLPSPESHPSEVDWASLAAGHHGGSRSTASTLDYADLQAIMREQSANPETVFHPDTRVRVSPTYGEIVHLRLYDSQSEELGHCSGTFIGPQVVLTAAHCLYHAEFDGFVGGVAVRPGADGAALPYGWDAGSWLYVPDEWADYQDQGINAWPWDYGIVFLDTPVLGQRVGWQPLSVMSDAGLLSANLLPITLGYPGDKPDSTQWMTMEPALLGVDEWLLYHRLDIYFGQSGSGTFRGADDRLIGIVSAGGNEFNVSVRIRPEVVNDLTAWCAVAVFAFP